MKTIRQFERSRTAPRGAFTIIELMIVITIIAALMALTASAVLKFIEVQQRSNTQSTLDRVQGELGKVWSKVKDEAWYRSPMTEPAISITMPPTPVGMPVGLWIQSNLAQVTASDPNAKERARVIYVKLKLRQAFPMSFAEALNPAPLPPLPGYVSYLGSMGITLANVASLFPTTGPYESSACLLMALQRGVAGASIDPAQLTTGGAAGSLAIAGGSISYLNDAWGRPIYFSRFPAGNLYLNPPINPTTGLPGTVNNPWGSVICYSQPGINDPGDPQGYLQTPTWGVSPQGKLFFSLSLQVPAAGNTSYKLAPLVASGGPLNWTKTGTIPPFDPITFYSPPGSGVLYSTPLQQ